jgi:dTDP-L-rhamnose 4-epimerase
VNVGSGSAVSVRKLAQLLSDALDIQIEPVTRGEFRPGEIRHLISDTQRITSSGYSTKVNFETGLGRYVDWIQRKADVRDYFSVAESVLRDAGIVQKSSSVRLTK